MNLNKGMGLGLVVFSLLSFNPLAQADQHDDGEIDSHHCRSVHGKIDTFLTQEGCDSNFKLCTEGETRGNGLLKGHTYYTTELLGPAANDPTAKSSFSYSGKLVISTRRGELIIEDLGIVDLLGGSFTEFSLKMSGTSKFQDVKGRLFFFGNATADGFSGDVRGTVCLGKDD